MTAGKDLLRLLRRRKMRILSWHQDMAQRQEQFQQEAYQSMQKAQQDAMAPIYQKLDEAIQAVGKAESVVYIFDLARTPIPFVGAQSIDVTAKVKTQLGIK